MAVPSAGLLYPVRFPATAYVIRVISDGVTEDLPFPQSGTLTVGRDYWVSGDSAADSAAGNGDLVQMLEDALNANSPAVVYTVTISSGNVITVTSDGNDFSILWAHANTTLDETIFGFTNANTASATSAVAPNSSQGAWLPARPPRVDGRPRVPVVGGVARAISGLQRTSRLATPYAERDLTFSLLPQAKALREYEAATDPFGSFEEAWLSSISLGRLLRYYPDASARTITSYTTYRSRSLDDPLSRMEPTTMLRWEVKLQLVGVA